MLKDPHGGALKERYLEEHELGEGRRKLPVPPS